MIPSWSSEIISSRSEQSMPFESMPRITPGFRSTPVPGMCVPGGAKTPTSPVRAFGAPQTTWTMSLGASGPPGQVSTRQSRSRSAFGCGTASTTRAIVNAPSVSPGSSTPSTSSPRSVSAAATWSTVASVSRCFFSHDSVNFIVPARHFRSRRVLSPNRAAQEGAAETGAGRR